MRLRKIKLVGFKSFVDPTTFTVPDKLVGIVGPNGCGKSNIIDAVTWVMGESSAKHLRGDALTDVIFNGSSSRQPTGQASVELLFENLDGKLGGQYASYTEISIKRQINREAISTYYLNGTRCRRKDIQGIFLGTGLGPRSYSIIEQGMISRLIDAKPEELRTFIEEAAGISKFRERRRETENRIRHTRENISRLTDIREELEKQLNHLQRQAKAAERYQILKQEERQLNAELLALNWQLLTEQAKAKSAIVQEHENQVQQGMANLRELESHIETQREQYSAANEGFNQAQSNYYQIGSDISQIEQKIAYIHEKIQSLNDDLQVAEKSGQNISQQKQQDERQLATIREKFSQLEPQLQGSRTQSHAAYTALTGAEGAMQAWQTEWDAINETLSEYNREFEVTNARIDYLHDDLHEATQRRQNLSSESEGQDLHALENELTQSANSQVEIDTTLQQQRQKQTTAQEDLKQLRGQLILLNSQLSELRTDKQANAARIASLEARQLGEALDHKENIDAWIHDNGLTAAARLIDQVTVEPQWFLAFETVAGHFLQDICVHDLSSVNANSSELAAGYIGLLSVSEDSASDYQPRNRMRLQDKLQTNTTFGYLLERIYIADTLVEAQAVLAELDATESVVTRDGVWLSPHWTRINKPAADDVGMLSREQQLKALQEMQQHLQQEIQPLETRVSATSGQIESKEHEIIALQEQHSQQQDHSAAAKARHAEFNARHEQAHNRMGQIEEELAELELQQQSNHEEMRSLQSQLEQIESDRAKMITQRQHLETVRDGHKESLEQARSQWQSTHQHSHEIALQLEAYSSQKASIEQAIKRSDIQLAGVHHRLQELHSSIERQTQPVEELQSSLKAKLDDKSKVESALSSARENVQRQEHALKAKEKARGEAEQKVQDMRSVLEHSRLENQETKVRLQTVAEQLRSLEREPTELLAQLEEGADDSTWQEKLESVGRKIQRLGAINLAAIDEYEQLCERKVYLDSQSEDLNQALETLETAIKKIDKETRTRFRETFDSINTNIKELFPLLFDGGHAYLEMTGQDLLATGVTIMARPPGKKNGTIHLLSGGEKALIAVALVFSIFKLNPAPFCILDEVDAPLDDTNVSRFSEMVEKMSEDIQFIIITHNKITMEIAQQLTGVTMQEAGVSRLVSVDMEQAVEMVATA